MADYISRNRAIFECERFFKGDKEAQEQCMSLLSILPSADVAPVRIGFWEIGGVNPANNVIGNFKCSLCKGTSLEDSDYCPNCGAKMEGVKNN